MIDILGDENRCPWKGREISESPKDTHVSLTGERAVC
jgi:hypothetical protein